MASKDDIKTLLTWFLVKAKTALCYLNMKENEESVKPPYFILVSILLVQKWEKKKKLDFIHLTSSINSNLGIPDCLKNTLNFT